MHRALFMAHQDMAHFLLMEQGIIDRQHCAAGVAENMLHPLVGERAHHHFGAGHCDAAYRYGHVLGSVCVSRVWLDGWGAGNVRDLPRDCSAGFVHLRLRRLRGHTPLHFIGRFHLSHAHISATVAQRTRH